jgi:hypothetical protein
METNSQSSRSWPNYALIILFAIFLLIPSLEMIFHFDTTTSRGENRLLAPLPVPPQSLRGLANYLSGWEAYYNDHFGCRRALILWHGKLLLHLFEDDSHEVLVGRDGWLYFSSGRMIDHYRGDSQFSEAELQGWQKLLEQRRNWLARRHIKFIFVLAPNKESIYPEHLPDWLKNPGRSTKADQFFAYMRTHSSVSLLDLRPTLLAAKGSGPLYMQTDTHWNELGAFLGCDQLVRLLADGKVSALKPLSLNAFNQTNALAPGGDLTRMLGVDMVESNAVYLSPKLELPELNLFEPTNETEGLWSFSKQTGGTGSAIVYHDSFGRFWIPFLGYQFKEVDYFRQYFLNPKIITEQQPTVVICEVLERFLNTADPAGLSAQDALP